MLCDYLLYVSNVDIADGKLVGYTVTDGTGLDVDGVNHAEELLGFTVPE
jgi:hypothetical protein